MSSSPELGGAAGGLKREPSGRPHRRQDHQHDEDADCDRLAKTVPEGTDQPEAFNRPDAPHQADRCEDCEQRIEPCRTLRVQKDRGQGEAEHEDAEVHRLVEASGDVVV